MSYLDQAHEVFTKWLGDEYDLEALDIMLAAAAVEQLDGEPVWMLLLSGSGNAKTETVQSLTGIDALVTSTISSPGALLSGTSKREKTDEATGGLLRKIGDRGIIVIKDVTSILSMNRMLRDEVLAALREIYDGHWSRNVGTDGGRTLAWHGRLSIIGAVTTAWDTHHAVIASMGDRFIVVRMDSTRGRASASRQAIRNTGHEDTMRYELEGRVNEVLTHLDDTPVELTEDEEDTIMRAADLVTLARTAVETDFRGDVVDAHAPEMPTRFVKQLTQIVRGAVAIGVDRDKALRLAIRAARDSLPPMRLAIIDDIAANPGSRTGEVRKRIDKPRSTVDRQLQALHQLGVLTVEELEAADARGNVRTSWNYFLAGGIDPSSLDLENLPGKVRRPLDPQESEQKTCPEKSGGPKPQEEEYVPPDIPGHIDDEDQEPIFTADVVTESGYRA